MKQRKSETEAYEKVGHRFHKPKCVHVEVCEQCGLVALNNDLTREAIRLGCDYKYHPSWRKLVRTHTQHNGPDYYE